MTYGLYFKHGKWADTLFVGGYSNRKNAELALAVYEGELWSNKLYAVASGDLEIKEIEGDFRSPADLDEKILGMIAESVK